MSVFSLSKKYVFPHPSLAEEDGLLAIGGDLSPERLLLAYANGIFPWYSEGDPICWFSPDPRCLLFPDKLKVTKSLRKTIEKKVFDVRFDTCFEQVIENCSSVPRPEQGGTWITKEIKEAYTKLHQLGFAHSVESFRGGQLVGGLYGISLGSAFFGESMFHFETDASKVAFVHLVERIKSWGFSFIDNQQVTKHLISLGSEEISRDRFLALLGEVILEPTKRGCWNSNFN